MEKLKIGSYEMWDFEDQITDDVNNTYDLKIFKNLLLKTWVKIVTHNPIGEYGHPKHKRLFETIKSITNNFYVFKLFNYFNGIIFRIIIKKNNFDIFISLRF